MTCQPCSKCGDGLYEEHKCRPNHDTVCNWCHNRKGIFNDDYIRKCTSAEVSDAFDDDSSAIKKAEEEEKRNEHNFGVPDDGDVRHEFWVFGKRVGPLDITDEKRVELKPTYHDYEMDSLQRLRTAAYRQRLYILLGFAAILVVIASVFLVWLVRECRQPRHRVIPGRQKLYAHLTDLDNEIIRQCAKRIDKDGKVKPLSQMPADSEDDYWEEPMRITDNPLDHYIAFSSTERLIPKAKC